MALSKEDLQAIQALLELKLDPINTRLGSSVEQINIRLGSLEEKFESFEEEQAIIRHSQLKVELEQFPRIAAALDGVVSGIDKNTEQDRRISILENKVENHDNRIISLEYMAKAK